jgi:hypothetical protein
LIQVSLTVIRAANGEVLFHSCGWQMATAAARAIARMVPVLALPAANGVLMCKKVSTRTHYFDEMPVIQTESRRRMFAGWPEEHASCGYGPR